MINPNSLERLLDEIHAIVKSKLEVRGREDMTPARDCFDAESTETHFRGYVVRVPVEDDLFLRIVSCNRAQVGIQELASRFAEELPAALVNIGAAKLSLRRYASDVQQAAAKAIEASQARGLDLTLTGVTFKRTRAHHLGQSNWRESAVDRSTE